MQMLFKYKLDAESAKLTHKNLRDAMMLNY